MKSKAAGFFLISIALLFSSCGDPTAPENLLEEDRYIDVFAELVVVNQIGEDNLDGVSREYLKEQIFDKYNVTKEQFERTHRYYQQQPEKHLQRLDKVENILTEQRDRFQDLLNDERKKIADSLSISDSLSKRNKFTIPADTSSIDNAQINIRK